MTLNVDKLLLDAHTLVVHLRDHEALADNIRAATVALHNKVEAMKQYQDDITELNEIAKHRPRSTLVLGIAQENRQIRELQQENRELQTALEEHQSALELIMQKYREHTMKLLQGNRIEKAIRDREAADKDSMCQLIDKIDEMAGVMQKAIEVDETVGNVEKERLSRLEVENRALREILEICTTSKDRILPAETRGNSELGIKANQDVLLGSGDQIGGSTVSANASSGSRQEVETVKDLEEKKKDRNPEADEKGDIAAKNREGPVVNAACSPTPAVRSSKDSTPPIVAGSKDSSSPAVVGSKDSSSPAVVGSKDTSSPAVVGSKDTSSPAVVGNKDTSSPAVVGSKDSSPKPGAATVKSPVDSRKGRLTPTGRPDSSVTLKKATPTPSPSAAKKETPGIKKSPSIEAKKDLKSKVTPKLLGKK